MAQQEIHLAIAFDQNYLEPFYALATSIIKNNKQNQVIIHAIVTGVDEAEREKIHQFLSANNCTIHFYAINDSRLTTFVLSGKWTAAVYYRLYFPFLVPASVERLLYLDTDTLVLNDLAPLFRTGLEEHPVGAVYDIYVKTQPKLGITEEGAYFNSGVLLIDVPRWKEQKISEKAFKYLIDYPETIFFVDQCALNFVLKDNWKKLDYKFNLLYTYINQEATKKELQKFIKDKVIIHFTLHRPWDPLCRNRYRYLYFYYLKASPSKRKSKVKKQSWKVLTKVIKIRLTEFYLDSTFLKKVWRKLKIRTA